MWDRSGKCPEICSVYQPQLYKLYMALVQWLQGFSECDFLYFLKENCSNYCSLQKQTWKVVTLYSMRMLWAFHTTLVEWKGVYSKLSLNQMFNSWLMVSLCFAFVNGAESDTQTKCKRSNKRKERAVDVKATKISPIAHVHFKEGFSFYRCLTPAWAEWNILSGCIRNQYADRESWHRAGFPCVLSKQQGDCSDKKY